MISSYTNSGSRTPRISGLNTNFSDQLNVLIPFLQPQPAAARAACRSDAGRCFYGRVDGFLAAHGPKYFSQSAYFFLPRRGRPDNL
jgi:hypothetical protein